MVTKEVMKQIIESVEKIRKPFNITINEQSSIPHFNSIDEARAYYKSEPFADFNNRFVKGFD